MSGTARVIPTSDIYSRIGVREPYFALRTLASFGKGIVEAEVPIELKSDWEAGPITAGEAARHLGLLATCALSECNPNRSLHYYLVKEAVLTRSPSPSRTARLEGKAWGELLDPRTGKGHAALYLRGGEVLFELDAEFQVLSQAEFDKLFERARRDMRGASRPPVSERRHTGELRVMRNNPYGSPLELRQLELSPGADLIEAKFGPIPPSACSGHYPMHPVLPTGIVMSALSQLCGELLRRRKGEVRYVVRHAAAHAEAMSVADETVHFEARFVGGSSKNFRFECKARSGKRNVGTLALTLQTA